MEGRSCWDLRPQRVPEISMECLLVAEFLIKKGSHCWQLTHWLCEADWPDEPKASLVSATPVLVAKCKLSNLGFLLGSGTRTHIPHACKISSIPNERCPQRLEVISLLVGKTQTMKILTKTKGGRYYFSPPRWASFSRVNILIYQHITYQDKLGFRRHLLRISQSYPWSYRN